MLEAGLVDLYSHVRIPHIEYDLENHNLFVLVAFSAALGGAVGIILALVLSELTDYLNRE